MQQRYYDPLIARFLSRDEVTAYQKPMTNFNAYVYALNNPYRFTDPDGRDSASCYSNGGCGGNNSFYTSREKLGSIADFIPVLGAVKGMVEAYQHPTVATVSIAVIGVIPEVGGTAKTLLKEGREAISMTTAVENGAAHAGEDANAILTKGGNVQFTSTTTDAAGNTVTKNARFDVNPKQYACTKRRPALEYRNASEWQANSERPSSY